MSPSVRTTFFLEPGSPPVCPDDDAVSEDGRVFVTYSGMSGRERRFVGLLSSPEEFAGTRRVDILSPGNGQAVPVRIHDSPIASLIEEQREEIDLSSTVSPQSK